MSSSSLFQPRLDILPAAQVELWPTLAPLRELGFVLHGGTAIALRLGHRVSIDFDFFTVKPLDRHAVASRIPDLAGAARIQDEPNAMSVLVERPSGSVKLSFFGDITFGRVGEPEQTDDNVATVASLDDLMAQKLKVVMQRVEAKDYIDISAMLRAGVDLERGMAGAMALFGVSFAPAECAKALVHFKGGDLARLAAEDRTILLQAVRALPRAITSAPKLSDQLGRAEE